MKDNFAIVLTSTIVPNSIKTKYIDPSKRRLEYLKAIEYYKNYGDIFFLENSSYQIEKDKDFYQYKNVYIRKFPTSQHYEKGKGYQEFEMLDNWIKSEKNLPEHWIKITGRYIITNFNHIYNDILTSNNELIIEQNSKKKWAHTNLFYISTEYYKNNFLGIFENCDDSSGKYIEHIIHDKIQGFSCCRVFKTLPLFEGINASTGIVFRYNFGKKIKHLANNLIYFFYKKTRLL